MENERIDDLELNGLKVIQNTSYFCFGMDSVLLANFVESNSNKNDILDMCSGTGVISLIISAKKKYNKIYAVELQNEMFNLLERNIAYNHVNDKIMGMCDDIKNVNNIRRTLVLNSNKDAFDIVVCNPPYKEVGTGILNEIDVKYIARHEIKCTLDDVFLSASKLLKTKGKLYLVHKPERLVDLFTIARKYNLEPKRLKFVYPTIKSSPSIVLLEYVKNGGNELKILDPIIEFDENGKYTEKIYEIYGSIKRNDSNNE